MTVTISYLKEKDGFVEGNKQGENVLAVMEIDDSKQIAKLTFTPDASLITRRKASRQAESVVKSGFLLQSGERVGIGYSLDVVEGDKLSEAHLREGHKYNRM